MIGISLVFITNLQMACARSTLPIRSECDKKYALQSVLRRIYVCVSVSLLMQSIYVEIGFKLRNLVEFVCTIDSTYTFRVYLSVFPDQSEDVGYVDG